MNESACWVLAFPWCYTTQFLQTWLDSCLEELAEHKGGLRILLACLFSSEKQEVSDQEFTGNSVI